MRVRCSLCGVAETPPSSKEPSKEADSFRPLLGLDHPVSCIPAATPPREAPKLPRCTAQPAQLRLPTLSWQLFILCMSPVSVLPCYGTLFRRRPWAATHPIKPLISSPAGPREETTRPSAQSLGTDRDACHTLCLVSATLCSQTAVCARPAYAQRCRTHTRTTDWETGRLERDWERWVTSASYRLNLGAVQTCRRARCCMAAPKTRGMRPQRHTSSIDHPARFSIGAVGSIREHLPVGWDGMD